MKLIQPVKGDITKYAPSGILSQGFNDPGTPPYLLVFYKSLGLDGHNGIDFWGERNTPIYAAHSGEVVYAGNTGSTAGNKIKLKGDGIYTYYLHNEKLLVETGDKVTTGQEIAKLGNSGSSSSFYMAPHLHFGLYECDASGNILNTNNGFRGAIDPMPYFINDMLKIIGNKTTDRQYVLGVDNKLRWIFNPTLLDDLHNAGVVDKFQVDWRDNLDDFSISSPWAVIK